MQIDKELSVTIPSANTVLTVGVFDGVHLGHRFLLARLADEAKKLNWQSAVVTFKTHPEDTIYSDKTLLWLDNLENRTRLIKSLGVDIVTAISFTPELRQLTPRGFLRKLQTHLKLKALLIGPDFAMGKNRKGNFEELLMLGQELQFSVEIIPAFKVGNETVSSSLIRDKLALGEIERVTELLGRMYSLEGKVVSGDQWGRKMGYPTANLNITPNQALPKDGVYATVTRTAGKVLPSVTNIGFRPTVGGTARTVETYVIDFQDELLGKDFSVDFVRRLRDEQHFSSVDDLKSQIGRDIEQAKPVLSKLIS